MAVTHPGLDITSEIEHQILADYRDVWKLVERRLAVVIAIVEQARAKGEPIERAWLVEQARLDKLSQLIEERVAAVDAKTAAEMERERERIVARGVSDAADQLRAMGIEPSFSPFAFERLGVGNRLPIPLQFQMTAARTARRARLLLMSGLVRGRNPRSVARDLRNLLGGEAWRALRIARTELLTAYRAAALDTYRANQDVVREWEWFAEPDACDFCHERDGDRFPVEEDFDTHPNCRCTSLPVVNGEV